MLSSIYDLIGCEIKSPVFPWKAKRATQFHTKQKRIKANRANGRRKKLCLQKKNGIKSEDVNQKWLGRYTGAKINCSCFCCWTTRIMFAPPSFCKRATVYKLSVSPLCGNIKITDFSIVVPKDEKFSSKLSDIGKLGTSKLLRKTPKFSAAPRRAPYYLLAGKFLLHVISHANTYNRTCHFLSPIVLYCL